MLSKEEFQNRKDLLKREKENSEMRHKFKMEELTFERATQVLFFENQMSAHRIKRADRQKDFRGSYNK